jgi:hypothetical protein
MTYSKTFKSSAFYPSKEVREWLAENDVTIHNVKDGGIHGNQSVYYSSPKLTAGQVKIGSGYGSLNGFHSLKFHSNDPFDKEAAA